MTWLVKEVTETVTHRRQTTRCDGCGTEVYQGRPVHGDLPLGWSIPEGWTSMNLPGKDKQGFTKHGHACSHECAKLVISKAFGVEIPGGQTGGIKRVIGVLSKGLARP